MSEFDIIVDNSQQNLKEVPSKVVEMYNLRMLYLHQNFIKQLPKDFFTKLPNLTWLDLRNNHLGAIPESIAYHQNLENLLVSDNKLETLPIALGLVPKLKVLQIADNPLVYPSTKIIMQGTKAILAYLKSQYEKIITPSSDLPQTEQTTNPQKQTNTTYDKFIPVSEPVPSLCVKGLSKLKLNSSGIVHQVSSNQSGSKILLKSYYEDEDQLRHTSESDVRSNAALKKNWMEKIRNLLDEQEKILQQERNLQALNTWRFDKKMEPMRQMSKEKFSVTAPYGTYPEYNTILSREELSQQIERMIQTNKNPPKKQDVEKLINDLSSQLKELQNKNHEAPVGETGLNHANEQIIKILDIHKKLLKLQHSNSFL